MVEDEEAQVEAVAPAPGKKRRWPLLVALVVVLAGGAGGYFWYSQHSAQAAAKTKGAEAKTPKAELYLPLEPAFVVNFRDDESMRYLQVTITLMAHDEAAIETAKSADPVIRDAMVSLLSSQDYAIISNAGGRQKLQAQALAAVQKVVRARLGRPGIDALYFTSFVMQ
ncbi:MAG: flagellar basal body-associated FliL family protein [Rhodanobacter sp.]